MKTQKQCLALHLGRWEGIFTEYTPDSLEIKAQKRSVITFEQPEPQIIRQTNAYFSMGSELVNSTPTSWEYRDFSVGLRFFEDGSFSNGKVQLAPFSDFATEQGFLVGDQKVRVVQQWNAQGITTSFTTIREIRGTWQDPGTTLISPDHLLGRWQGSTTTFTAAEYTPIISEIELEFQRDQDDWTEQIKIAGQTIKIDGVIAGSRLYLPKFKGQMLFLPGNLIVYSPEQLPISTHSDRSFKVGLGWLPAPDIYLRMIRQYDQNGSWQSVALLQAKKI